MAPKKSALNHLPIVAESAEQAFTTLRQEIEAVPEAALARINLDVSSACTIALGAADLVWPMLPELRTLPSYDYAAVEKLRLYALAALYANAVATEATGGKRVALILADASPLRESLLVAAEALAHRQYLSPARVAEIRSGSGHVDTADDLIALAALFRESWAAVTGKTAVTMEEVERAAVLGSELHAALGARKVGAIEPGLPPDLGRMRDRAFTLLVRAYSECRRGVMFLRWGIGDAGRWVPSLYGRRRRRTLNEGTEVEEGEAPTGLEVPMEETLGEDAGEGPQASGAGAGVAPEGADDLGPVLR